MLNNHQKAFLKNKANALRPLYQIGKNLLGETQLDLLDKGLKAKELIKISVLKSAENPIEGIAIDISMKLQAEVVQIVGRIITLYRANPHLPHRIELPR